MESRAGKNLPGETGTLCGLPVDHPGLDYLAGHDCLVSGIVVRKVLLGVEVRIRGRSDANQSRIVRDLRECGYSVLVMSNLGDGAPDICCGAGGVNYFFELKDHNAKPSEKRLTENEKTFHSLWRGQIAVAETSEEIIRIIQGKV